VSRPPTVGRLVKRWPPIARRIRIPLGFGLAIVYFWLAQPTAKSILVGSLVALPGLLIRALASGHVDKNRELATSGPYGYSRNPLYLGSLVLAVGFTVASRSWWLAGAMLLVFCAVYLPVIGAEEVFLESRFPQYASYAREVPRLFPRWQRYRHSPEAFSWELYWKHREYNALLGAALMGAALVAKLLWITHRHHLGIS
jgi:protein-S-isoprenylcysteine O-methyltransferase Ste14